MENRKDWTDENTFVHEDNLDHMRLLANGIGFDKVIETAVDFYREIITKVFRDFLDKKSK